MPTQEAAGRPRPVMKTMRFLEVLDGGMYVYEIGAFGFEGRDSSFGGGMGGVDILMFREGGVS